MPVAVLGDRACGKTTFIALLYAAQIEFTNNIENKENFKFTADPHVAAYMGEMYNSLRIGQWPDATIKGHSSKISFLFGYKRAAAAAMPSWVKKRGWAKPYSTLEFSVYDVAGEDVQDIIRTPDGYMSEEIPEEAKELLESRVLVFLIDAQKISAKVRSKPYMKMINYDKEMATLISLIASYNSKKTDAQLRKIYPVIVFTKFDMVPKSTLQEMGLDETYPGFKDQKKRKKFAEDIMRRFYKQTLAYLKGGSLKGVSFDEAAYLFSEVMTEFDEEQGFESPKMKGDEVAYSYPEYEAFINHFRRIANEMPDDIKDSQDFTSKW
ncbi:MAG: hypothetical protein ACMUIE_09215 [Thermoplasmatota archaeon]